MKKTKFNFLLWSVMIIGIFFITSCGDDEPIVTVDDPVASFQFEIDGTNFLQVTFTNFSQKAESYSWNFDDGNTSTEENPVHTYTAAGTYNVELTATNSVNKSSTFSASFTLTDPNEALKLLTGEDSKTWKLFRDGVALQLGPDAGNPGGWWPGLSNDGTRPCLYYQTFTYHLDGAFVYDDMGMFWGENDPWGGTDLHETCFETTAANMVNKDGADVSAWGSGTHSFAYDPSTGEVTLTGMGAWMGLVHTVGTPDLYSNVPTATRTFNVSITQETGYDLMTLTYDYGADGLWTCMYVHYTDESLEPDVETEGMEFGEDLEDIAPTAMGHTFASDTEFELLGLISGGSTIATGVEDPADAGATKVGLFTRVGGTPFQEAKLQVSPEPKDIDFSNLTTISIDVFIPSTNDFTGALTKTVILGLADQSRTEQWWTDITQYETDGTTPEDEWVTLTYQLDSPTSGEGGSPFARTDYDMFFINIGGGNHNEEGIFYIRNFRFE